MPAEVANSATFGCKAPRFISSAITASRIVQGGPKRLVQVDRTAQFWHALSFHDPSVKTGSPSLLAGDYSEPGSWRQLRINNLPGCSARFYAPQRNTTIDEKEA
jgi:hypothetical protein